MRQARAPEMQDQRLEEDVYEALLGGWACEELRIDFARWGVRRWEKW